MIEPDSNAIQKARVMLIITRAFSLQVVADVSGKALAAGGAKGPAASTLPLMNPLPNDTSF